MSTIPFVTGLHRLSDHVQVWIRPDGGWGLSNAGLVHQGPEGLLVDTQYDLAMTGELGDAVRKVLTDGADPRRIVLTHGNGDHYYGCSLFPQAELVACDHAVDEMIGIGPGKMALFQKLHWLLGKAGRYFTREFGRFGFAGMPEVLPDHVFSGSMRLQVGTVDVEIRELGAIHSKSDSIVWVPSEGVLFAGDLLFTSGTPIVWEGDYPDLCRAYDYMESLGARWIVPGHGPVCGKEGIDRSRSYFDLVYRHAQSCAQQGIPLMQAALTLELGEFASLNHPERAVINLAAFYRHLVPGFKALSSIKLFALMEAWVGKKHGKSGA